MTAGRTSDEPSHTGTDVDSSAGRHRSKSHLPLDSSRNADRMNLCSTCFDRDKFGHLGKLPNWTLVQRIASWMQRHQTAEVTRMRHLAETLFLQFMQLMSN